MVNSNLSVVKDNLNGFKILSSSTVIELASDGIGFLQLGNTYNEAYAFIQPIGGDSFCSYCAINDIKSAFQVMFRNTEGLITGQSIGVMYLALVK